MCKDLNNTYMYRECKETYTVLYLHPERIVRQNARQIYGKLATADLWGMLCAPLQHASLGTQLACFINS